MKLDLDLDVQLRYVSTGAALHIRRSEFGAWFMVGLLRGRARPRLCYGVDSTGDQRWFAHLAINLWVVAFGMSLEVPYLHRRKP